MGKKETYRDIMYCDHCDKDTEQIIHSSGHERDGSGDWQVCTECGWRLSGYSSEWNEFATKEDVKKWYKKIK